MLGKYFRERYAALIPPDVVPSKIAYVLSSDRDRALMSASANMAGLFPPTTEQIWNEDLIWQPIPIYSIPKPIDHLIGTSRDCHLYNFLYKKNFETEKYKEERLKYKALYDYFGEKSGQTMEDPDNIIYLQDTLYVHMLKNKT